MDYARESARMVLPLNTYTEWYWKVDLHNLLHFLRLRADSHAQWEIQQYALVILGIVKGWMPNVYQAFLDYRLNAKTLSAQQWAAVKQLVMYTNRSAGDLAHTMSKRELDELNAWLD
jgi:thymidylate synthase (FAD)